MNSVRIRVGAIAFFAAPIVLSSCGTSTDISTAPLVRIDESAGQASASSASPASPASVSAIFQGDESYTVEDAALALAALYVPSLLDEPSDGGEFAAVANQILQGGNAIATVTPIPTRTSLDFVQPEETLDLRDISVFLAAVGVSSTDLSDLDLIASRASNVLSADNGFSGSDIFRQLIPEENLEGSWSGTAVLTAGTGAYANAIGSSFGVTFNLDLNLTTSQITGTWSDDLGGGGNLSGTLNDLQIENLIVNDTTPDCEGQSRGSGSFSEDFSQLSFTLSGSDCDGSFSTETSQNNPPVRQ